MKTLFYGTRQMGLRDSQELHFSADPPVWASPSERRALEGFLLGFLKSCPRSLQDAIHHINPTLGRTAYVCQSRTCVVQNLCFQVRVRGKSVWVRMSGATSARGVTTHTEIRGSESHSSEKTPALTHHGDQDVSPCLVSVAQK